MPNLRTSPAADISREFQTGLPPDVRTRPYISYEYIDVSSSTVLSAGESETTDIYPPEGIIYVCKALILISQPPTDATAGEHYFIMNAMGHIDILELMSNYGDELIYRCCEIVKATKVAQPGDKTAQILVLEHLLADENNPVKVIYKNNTDVSQDNVRKVKLLMERVKV